MNLLKDLKDDVSKSINKVCEKNKQWVEMIKYENKQNSSRNENRNRTTKENLNPDKSGVKTLGSQTKTSKASLTNSAEEMGDRFSGTEDKIEEMNTLVKENVKSGTTQAQNIQEMWDTVKRSNL
jgi:hypothetical protein